MPVIADGMQTQEFASWRKGPARQAIVDFVASATTPGPGFVAVADRIAARTCPPRSARENYFPHLTVGVATFDDLKIIEAQPFEPSTVHAAGVAVYHLGNNDTARKLLKEWPLTNS